MIIDVFPFYNELDTLEVRLNELRDAVDLHFIVESNESYGGEPRKSVLNDNWDYVKERFADFMPKIYVVTLTNLLPPADGTRTAGRAREHFQRNYMFNVLRSVSLEDPRIKDSYVIFSDCDEIPRAEALKNHVAKRPVGIWRLKQTSYYYDVNTVVDYGHDFASRARIGRFVDLMAAGTMMDFRMANEKSETYAIEDAGWHFGYFGGVEQIKEKVKSLQTFLKEYWLGTDEELSADIQQGRDLHRRKCEMPDQFDIVPTADTLPKYLLENKEKFQHFFKGGF